MKVIADFFGESIAKRFLFFFFSSFFRITNHAFAADCNGLGLISLVAVTNNVVISANAFDSSLRPIHSAKAVAINFNLVAYAKLAALLLNRSFCCFRQSRLILRCLSRFVLSVFLLCL